VRYEPEWISFSEARQRLMSRGLTQPEAETDITLAYRDRKLNYRATPEKITTLSGGTISTHFLRRLAFKNELKLRLAIPHDLGPADIDWENSRPRKPWRYGDPWQEFLAHIAKLELSSKDVTRVLCGGVADTSVADISEDTPRGEELPLVTAGRKRPMRELADHAMEQIFPAGVPSKDELAHDELVQRVADFLKEAGHRHLPGKDTILRAAGRRKQGSNSK
jgi:hypothetical protein